MERRIEYKPLQQPMRPQREREPVKKSNDGGMLGGLLSDERSKQEIARLESANEALTRALSVKADYPTPKPPESDEMGTGRLDGAVMATSRGNMPPEYPKMPGNTTLPVGRAGFPAGDAADKVAAQNVGLQAPGGGMQPNPSQSNFARSNNPAFQGVGGNLPDLSALDEAYKRMGRGG